MQHFRRPYLMRFLTLVGILLVSFYSYVVVCAPANAAMPGHEAPMTDCHMQADNHDEKPTKTSMPDCCSSLACCHLMLHAIAYPIAEPHVQPLQLAAAATTFNLQGMMYLPERPPRTTA